jgi:hypothetical protein
MAATIPDTKSEKGKRLHAFSFRVQGDWRCAGLMRIEVRSAVAGHAGAISVSALPCFAAKFEAVRRNDYERLAL